MFKENDRVRVIKSDDEPVYVGMLGTVLEVLDPKDFKDSIFAPMVETLTITVELDCHKGDDACDWFCPEQLELVTKEVAK